MTDTTPPLAASTLSVNALARPLVERLLADAEALAAAGAPRHERRLHRRCRHRGARQRRGRPAGRRDLHGRPRPRGACAPARLEGWPTWLEVQQRAAGAGLPGQPVRRLEPGGEQGGNRRQEVLLARLGPGARAGRQGRRCSPNSATATAPNRACWCSRSIGRRPRWSSTSCCATAALTRRRADPDPDADHQPGRHHAGGGARAGGGAAQGARAGLRARPHRRRRGGRAAARAQPRRRAGHGPHQRRHPVRRPGAPHRARRRCRGARSSPGSCRRATRATTAARSPTSSRRSSYDFYKIDGALFAPAEVWVSNLDSGNTWHGGALNMPLLRGCGCRRRDDRV